MAPDPAGTPTPKNGKLSGWPRPRPSIAKQMGLNPFRVAILIAMALGGLSGGYFLGKEVAPAPKPAPSSSPTTPHQMHTSAHNIYEESLPRDIIIESGGILKRIDLPEPDAVIDLGKGTESGVGKSATTAPAGSGNAVSAPPETSEASQAAPTTPADTAETQAKSTPEAPQAPVKQAEQTETAAITTLGNLVRPKHALPENIAELQRNSAKDLPPWQRYALPVTLSGKPEIVIVIDDLGLDRRGTKRIMELPGPLTLSFMSYAEDLAKQSGQARKAGHELMLHVPMEPGSPAINPGPNVLLSGMPVSELQKNINWNLDQMDGYVGINNHMGSRFTADREGMTTVVEVLKKRGYLFLDSVTSAKSVAHDVARDGGIPFAIRNVFLDHDDDLDEIRNQLRHTEQIAKRTGLAIAIGHPRDKTIEALQAWLPTLEKKGFQLVPVSSVVRIAPGT